MDVYKEIAVLCDKYKKYKKNASSNAVCYQWLTEQYGQYDAFEQKMILQTLKNYGQVIPQEGLGDALNFAAIILAIIALLKDVLFSGWYKWIVVVFIIAVIGNSCFNLTQTIVVVNGRTKESQIRVEILSMLEIWAEENQKEGSSEQISRHLEGLTEIYEESKGESSL